MIQWTRNANGTGTATHTVDGVQPDASAPLAATVTLHTSSLRPSTAPWPGRRGIDPSILAWVADYTPGEYIGQPACECPDGMTCHCESESTDRTDY